jgi:hypothetical protein
MANMTMTLGGGPIEAAPGSTCMCVKTNKTVCGKPAVNGLCTYHAKIQEKRLEKERITWEQNVSYRNYRTVLRQYSWDNPDADIEVVWNHLTDEVNRGIIRVNHRRMLLRVFMDWRARRQNADARLAVEVPKPVLQQFAEDNQNVHRKVVTDNTNTQTDKLLAVPVPVEQDTLADIRKLFGKSRKVMSDVEHWYGITLCRKEADCLYKRTLDGLWAMIKASEHKDELCKRLKEELTEAVGMCCEGHLSRLCNVLVGFDDAFTTVVSKKEILQQKMADIAALDVTERTKKMRARKVLRELDIPVSEHSAWLDAF